ncbi:hypothetical protein SMSP2_01749 [Limihaloglobus sulfuriphilus]|uniref:Uncharacterized protein n=1 Tax=Limihaloglobus sulfuriphilus TaxID=1851148 RepID=A0A1Q2MFA2_9BACT|nr:hypothetical protein [Limihaloglobus sulfuriphilus]AQQ71376.1 hypothetical protein SMSP2_01749 [Limihaloglobus sulfuriphilus]
MAEYNGNNIFEKLGALIPGYKGYSEREGRRETDKILREQIVDSLNNNISVLYKWNRAFLKEGHLEQLTEVEDIEKKLRIITDQIKFAQCGDSGFFDVVQVNEKTLDNLYLYDMAFKKKVDEFITNLNSINSHQRKGVGLENLSEQLDSLKQIVENRDKLITEIE